jgi:hypothetical protein
MILFNAGGLFVRFSCQTVRQLPKLIETFLTAMQRTPKFKNEDALVNITVRVPAKWMPVMKRIASDGHRDVAKLIRFWIEPNLPPEVRSGKGARLNTF